MKSLVIGPFPNLWPTVGTAVLIDDYCLSDDESVSARNVTFEVATNCFKNQKHNDDLYKTITELSDVFLKELTVQLNTYHEKKYPNKYWSLIVSHWLMKCIEDLVKTYTEVNQAINEHNVSWVNVSSARSNDFTPNNSYDYAYLRLKEEYIVMLRSEVIRHVNSQFTNLKIAETEIKCNAPQRFISKASKRAQVLTEINLLISNLFRKVTRRAQIFVTTSYLPIWSEVFIKLSLGQSPTMRIISEIKPSSTRSEFRNHIFDNVKTNHPLGDFLSSQIKWLIPRTYLEDYKALENLINSSNWPEKPRVIFTANSFDTDDEFKIWSAQKMLGGSVYVVMQHGNNFGTYRYPIHPEIQLADYFLTWGWSNHPKEIPLFCQTIKQRKRVGSKNNHSLLILRRQVPLRENITDHPNRLRESLLEENKILTTLNKEIRMVTKFKDHPASKHKTDIFDPGENTVGAEKKFLKHTKVAKQIYSTNKLVFFECYSTGVLECLSLNIPVIFYWPEGLDSIRDESVEDFRELENSQILFFSGVKAAAHVNTIWSDLDVWWESPQVQEARKNFVDKYARSTDCPIRQLRKTLKEIERERW